MMAFFEVKAFCFPTYLAKETIDLLELIYTNKAATETSCIAMIEHLKKCEDKDMIPRELTGKLKSIAHKIGAVSEARTPNLSLIFTAENPGVPFSMINAVIPFESSNSPVLIKTTETSPDKP